MTSQKEQDMTIYESGNLSCMLVRLPGLERLVRIKYRTAMGDSRSSGCILLARQ